ncbi:MAG: PilZ domain-containing protein [Elusimicrobiota bacterium]
MELPRRVHARFPCRIAVRLRAGPSSWPAEIVEISAGGAVVRVDADLPGPMMEIDVPEPGGTAIIRSRIVRRTGSDYAVQFEPHFSEQHKLKRIVDAARRSSGPA